ncbi:A-kinase anchor protein 7 isoform X2 [Sphaeramia orbicularis]|uniref:Protein kinase A anchor protein nuclear localisation signal domain-containing protein n=1 Tax=Sphaeramia orbicularis TaxID=375764 RepID=A0A673CDN6_9TELE|nr:A-kinase anchoring protein 7 isoform X2 [Sphaeramia orbicularis]
MLIGKLTFSFTCFWSFTRLQRVFIFNKRVVSRVHHISTSYHHSAPFAHRTGLKPLVVMLPANISHGNDTTVLASEDDDDEGGGDEMVSQEGGMINEAEVKTMKVTPSKEGMMSMEIQRSTADCGATTVTGSNEKKIKRKMRREKRKLLKKKHKSDDTMETLMSELPFAFTSPSLWKELGFTNSESSQKKRKRGDSGGRVDSEDDVEKKKKKKKESKRPNYFVSIPITNPQISSVIAEVQKAVLEQEPRLAKAMIPIPSLHITLLVTHLSNQVEVDQAVTVLAGAEPLLAELLGGRDLVLPFSGIGHFRKEVVFVGLVPGQHRHTLDSLAELLRARFAEQGLLQEDCRGFEPHLTIMKLSRASKLRSQGIKRVDPALYSNYTDRFFGDQTVERVDLCSMLKKKQKDGYYHTETSLQLGGRRRSEPDEAELLRVSKRLVEDAVNRALQQYKQETLQNGGGPKATAAQPPGNTEESATKTDTTANSTTDNRK